MIKDMGMSAIMHLKNMVSNVLSVSLKYLHSPNMAANKKTDPL